VFPTAPKTRNVASRQRSDWWQSSGGSVECAVAAVLADEGGDGVGGDDDVGDWNWNENESEDPTEWEEVAQIARTERTGHFGAVPVNPVGDGAGD